MGHIVFIAVINNSVMKIMAFKYIVITLLSIIISDIHAQYNKKRGDRDYTNNKSQGKPDAGKDVNTAKETPVKIIEYIPGTWVIDHVYKGKDLAQNDTLAKNQKIEFNREGRFVSFSENEKIDSGAYRINEEHAILYMASVGDNKKPVEWDVWFDKDGTMTMKKRRTEKDGQDLGFVYRREGSTTSSNRKQ
jgi:hypothetical protein